MCNRDTDLQFPGASLIEDGSIKVEEECAANGNEEPRKDYGNQNYSAENRRKGAGEHSQRIWVNVASVPLTDTDGINEPPIILSIVSMSKIVIMLVKLIALPET